MFSDEHSIVSFLNNLASVTAVSKIVLPKTPFQIIGDKNSIKASQNATVCIASFQDVVLIVSQSFEAYCIYLQKSILPNVDMYKGTRQGIYQITLSENYDRN